ncbi:hypothetical protein PR003_g29073 [Phytophthora rubi]|uniref:Uncharacterized protein n=1 Tax=Phytophthora rubi TaxID=129364 RepID=A0A6A3HC96_9STRA|nr:hypothetical protein PF003_g35025 [Phytophthora fragariae]KAE8966920.1 hypothetical protein PR002_g28219 [Phytophthora rubi]KAE9276402.1 hypothetical protein PR003_g29073 [Phytophthora rubi]
MRHRSLVEIDRDFIASAVFVVGISTLMIFSVDAEMLTTKTALVMKTLLTTQHM